MIEIKTDQLKHGMVLAEDVCNSNGRLLLPKGQELEVGHLRILKMWGIFQIRIEGDDPDGLEPVDGQDAARSDQARMDILQRFANLDPDHPAVREVVEICVAFRLKHGPFPSPAPVESRPASPEAPADAAKIMAGFEQRDIKLPEVPSLVFELNEIMANPLTSSGDIAQVVNKSPSLASLLLRIVNSAFYGFPGKIDRISRAVALIGSKEISSLALGISTMRIFDEIPKEIIDVRAFFRHSLSCGILSRILAAHLNISKTEQLFVSGLLHDIGRVILFRYFPKVTAAMLADARSSGKRLYDAEFESLRCRHTHVGRDLLRKWKLPASLEHGIYFHHTPSKAPEVSRAAVVHLADICVHALGLGASGEHMIPPLDQAAIQTLRIAPGSLKATISQTLHQLEYLESAFQENSQDD
jgi:HD-like signal output (HDOD) protein